MDENSNVTLLRVTHEDTEELWKLLTKMNVDMFVVTPHDLRSVQTRPRIYERAF